MISEELFSLHPARGPIWKQIESEIRRRIASGQLRAGEAVPSGRRLAKRLSVTRDTVKQAYKHLIAQGVLVSRRGRGTFVVPHQSQKPQRREDIAMPPAARPESNHIVAGVPVIDSSIALSARELAKDAYPPYLFNHAMRTYIFGSLVGRARGHPFDHETLYLACLLHDLGLTRGFEGELPFEIQGAEAARAFLLGQGVPQEKTDVIWDGIALHASAVAQFKQPEIALVGAGARVDVFGPDLDEIPHDEVAATLAAFPRLKFKTSFLRTCAAVVQRHPAAATRSFMRDIGERFVRGFKPKNFCDLLDESPFPE